MQAKSLVQVRYGHECMCAMVQKSRELWSFGAGPMAVLCDGARCGAGQGRAGGGGVISYAQCSIFGSAQ